MLWVEKYRPKSFEELKGRDDLVAMLKSYSLENVPHLLFHGQLGHGKRTIIHSLINHLYGEMQEPALKTTEIVGSTGKAIEISYLESGGYIEISPSDYNYQDRVVIQSVIKQMVQSRPIFGFLSGKASMSLRFIVINDGEDLSRDAQAALRRTIERYSENVRIILICNELSNIIEPIRSRCVCFRVPGLTDEAICTHMNTILKKESRFLSEGSLLEIVKVSSGNMLKAICLLESTCSSLESHSSKRAKTNGGITKLEWEKKIELIVSYMRGQQSTEILMKIRAELYELLVSCVPPKMILIELVRHLISCVKVELFPKICHLGSLYDERLRLGTKGIIHLEGFVTAVLVLLSEK
jgi:replication factor C subunit 3/5